MPPISRTDSVARVNAPPAPGEAETRFFGAVDSPVAVVLDTEGRRGSVSADAPLDGFRPPLTRDALAGLSIRISMPPNEAGVLPATVIEKNGRAYLHVELKSAEVSALNAAPFIVAVGDAASLSGTAMVPKLILQVTAQDLKVDTLAPRLAAELNSRPNQVSFIAGLESDKAGMLNGTSTWFGGHQLEQERARLAKELAAITASLEPKLAALERTLLDDTPVNAALALRADIDPGSEVLRKAAIDSANLSARAKELEQRRLDVTSVPQLVVAVDAELIPLKAKATAAALEVRASVDALYAKLRAENPDAADQWLNTYASSHQLSGAGELQSLTSNRKWTAQNLATTDADLARMQTQLATNAPTVIENLTARIATAKAALAERDAVIAGMRSPGAAHVEDFKTSYPADKAFI